MIKNKTWQEKSLENISIKISAGGTPKRKIKTYWENGDIIWIKIRDLKTGIIEDSEEKITKQGLKESSAKIFPKDILVGKVIKVNKNGFIALPYVDFNNLDIVQAINTN